MAEPNFGDCPPKMCQGQDERVCNLGNQGYVSFHPARLWVGPHVYVFDGAAGKQTLDKWDPSGYYINHGCIYNGLPLVDPECAYDRAKRDLTNNGFSENQVQAIFIKTANSYPQCDLSGGHCLGTALLPDAYKAEQQLGDILRYLKCCKADGTSRYPNLRQVFWCATCQSS